MKEIINELLIKIEFIDEDDIKPESKIIDDLGFDSLDCIEFLMNVENEFGISIPDDEAEKCKTVQDVYDYVKSKTK